MLTSNELAAAPQDIDAATFTALLAARAQLTPDAIAYVFLRDGEQEGERLSYAALDRAARRVADVIRRQARFGDRALLLFPFGADYLAAFFGCLYAGVIAMPAYPPSPARPERAFARLDAMMRDAGAALVLGTADVVDAVRAAGAAWGDARFIAADAWSEGDASFEPVGIEPGTLAFLQYTSGSTGTPKGVMLTHANLLHNSAQIRDAFGNDATTRVVSWLPLYHDMGLIGGVLQPLFLGTPCVLMSPVDFLQRPLRWLEAIAHYRATTSGGPNFAYALCTRRSTPAQRAALDLSSWRTAFNGAEPVRAATLAAFAEAYADAGFDARAFHPCYGLAEATLLVCAAPSQTPLRSVRLDADALAAHRAVETSEESATTAISCGNTWGGQDVAIVDRSRHALGDGAVGEIWVRGAGVARGYWGREAATQETFGARLDDGSGPFLRTGDLGFVREGHLYVTGRLKDLVVLRGRNLYPQDIEATAEAASEAVHAGACAAVAIDEDGSEALAIVAEIDRHHRDRSPETIAAAIRAAVADAHDAQVARVTLLRPGTLPKTSSGKLMRSACRALALDGGAAVVWDSTQAAGARDDDGELAAIAARALGAPVDDEHRPLAGYGLDSLAALELAAAVEARHGIELAIPELLSTLTLARLRALVAAAPQRETAAIVADTAGEFILSPGQRELWFESRRAGHDASAWHVAAAFVLDGTLDAALFGEALDRLVARHDALRVAVVDRDGVPAQRLRASRGGTLAMHDARRWSDDALSDWLHAVAREPIDLVRDDAAPFAAHLLRRADERQVLLVVAHHLVLDLASAATLIGEWMAAYAALAGGDEPVFAPLTARYADAVAARDAETRSGAAAQDLHWWRERLTALPAQDLPLSRPRGAAPTRRGARRRTNLGTARSAAIRAAAREAGVTLNAWLLAAFQTLLHRWSGSDDLVIALPSLGAEALHPGAPLGYRVRPLLARSTLARDTTFATHAAGAQAALTGALMHRRCAYSAIADAADARRLARREPAHAWFVLQRASDAALGCLLVGETPRHPPTRAGIAWSALPLDARDVANELALILVDDGDALRATFEYATDVYTPACIERLAARFVALVDNVLADASTRIAELPRVAPDERDALLALSRGPARAASQDTLAARFFRQAQQTPEVTALVAGDSALRYDALAGRVRRAANALTAYGVRRGDRVALVLPRKPDLVVAMLAALAVDAVYAPVDPAHPPARVRELLADARAVLVVADEASPHHAAAIELGIAACAPAALDGRDDAPASTNDGAAPAYLLYTSGSTGTPKGVLCTHAAALNLVDDFDARGAVTAGDACSWWTSPTFDVSVFEVFGALLRGGTLHLVDEALRADARGLVDWIARTHIAHAYVPPFALQELADAARQGRLASLRRVLVGVEPIPLALLAGLRRDVPGLAVINGYGPTEATVCATAYDVALDGDEDAASIAPIGAPLTGVTAYVLGTDGELVPFGVDGELYVGGAGLALGYHDRRAATALRFVPDTWSGVPGARLYRTGDVVRRRDDGALVFRGRADAQIKLHGLRIEPGEIEAALRAHASVRDAVVVLRDSGATRVLIAYVVGTDDVAALHAHLAERLPAALRPAQIMPLAALPLTAHGKIDRGALPAPAAAAATGTAPQSATERTLADIWRSAFGSEAIARDDDFFALGGHSLLAATIVQRAAAAFGVDIAVDALLAAPTIAAFAQAIDRRIAGAGCTTPMAIARDGDLAASFQQQRLWLLQALDPAGTAYNVACALRLDGALDHAALSRAFDALVARHEALRTSLLAVDGRILQRIADAVAFTLTPEPIAADALDARLKHEAAQPFDLAQAPLLRVRLFALAPQQHLLFLVTHHAVFDGTHDVFLRDLRELYRAEVDGTDPQLPALSLQPADIAAYEREALTPARHQRLADYWRQALSGEQPALQLTTDRPRPARASGRGAKHRFRWPAALAAALRAFARAEGVTTFAAALAAYQLLLSRLSGQARVQVGTPVALTATPAVRDLVGSFVNTLVLRADITPDLTFRHLVRATRDRVHGALAHQELPFDRLVDALAPARDPSRPPLCQTMFVLQPDPWRTRPWAGLDATPLDVDSGGARFDLLVSLWESDDGITGAIEYATDLFDAATMARIESHYRVLLEAALAAPTAVAAGLPLLTSAERTMQLQDWNDTARAVDTDVTIQTGFERRAREQPQAIAVIDSNGGMTYRELDAAANRLAHALQARGIGRGSHVAVLVPRTRELIVALLGVVKAGAAYVPLDVSLPAARCAHAARTVGAMALVTVSAHAARAEALRVDAALAHVVDIDDTERLAAYPETPPLCDALADDVAYVIFTSGSTGQPKGVTMQHRPVANLIDWVNRRFAVGPDDRLLFVTSPCFDLSVYDVFGALAAGASVRIASEAEVRDPERLYAVLRNERITFWDSAPATLQQLAPLFARGGGPRLRLALLSGDWIPVGLPDALRAAFPNTEVVSLGGATEAAIWSNFHRIAQVAPEWTSIPYGRPIQNARYYVLDARFAPQPAGVPGELYIGGDCLALGYAAAPRLTGERFLPDPHAGRPGARMYRTGDLVRFEPDGTMIFLGRVDFQVKIRGFRVETGEIEHAIAADAGVAAVVVLVREDVPGQRRLVAYVVPRDLDDALTGRLRATLSNLLPEYMQPAAWVLLPALPLNANGKVDRNALPAPHDGAGKAARVAPRDAVEERIHAIWAECLGHDHFGVEDGYFDVGGHSLSAFQTVSRIREAFGVELPLRTLFEAPTVAALAQAVHAADAILEVPPVLADLPVSAAPVRDLSDLLAELEAADPVKGILP
ncbi:amino acid adenylation domain-containing protein [Tahibacter sp. UC22_41]|uniref:amino acid adenylation domain-containing protein n=1 Tax=Tahibacter sp. UC22_41 TaxID=3350178 RepID=UPI0036DAD8F2